MNEKERIEWLETKIKWHLDKARELEKELNALQPDRTSFYLTNIKQRGVKSSH